MLGLNFVSKNILILQKLFVNSTKYRLWVSNDTKTTLYLYKYREIILKRSCKSILFATFCYKLTLAVDTNYQSTLLIFYARTKARKHVHSTTTSLWCVFIALARQISDLKILKLIISRVSYRREPYFLVLHVFYIVCKWSTLFISIIFISS